MGCNPTKNDGEPAGLGAGEIYETALDVGMDELDANVIAHLETLGTLREPPFGRWL
jgi:hypothetical protein